jgi:thioredoxin 2
MAVLASDDRGVRVGCPSCGGTSRLRYPHLHRTIRCARCHATLAPASAPVDASDVAVFDALLAGSALPVVVDFWAPWCGPCRVLAPEVEQLAASMAGEALVVKVNTVDAPELGERFRIRSIPTLAVFDRGSELARHSGVLPAAALRDFVTRSLATRR